MTTSYLLYCLAIIVLSLVVYAVFAYNRLVLLRQRHLSAFSQIDVQLKRRHDLIPNLVQVVKESMRHERETLENLVRAREGGRRALVSGSSAMNAAMLEAVSVAESGISQALSFFLGIVENYPDLKASLNSSELMEELRTTENRIAFARQHYNDTVARYNSYRESFPVNLLAAGLGFDRAGLLEFEELSFRDSPTVAF